MKPDARHIETYGHGGKLGVLLEVALGTAFTTRMPEFRSLARDLVLHIAAASPLNAEQMLRQPFAKDPDVTVYELLQRASSTLGEPIEVVRFARWTTETSDEREPPHDVPQQKRAA